MTDRNNALPDLTSAYQRFVGKPGPGRNVSWRVWVMGGLGIVLLLSLTASTIMLAIIWTFIWLTEYAEQETRELPNEAEHWRFFTTHGMPFVLFLLAAVIFPRYQSLAHGWREIALALLGVGVGYLLSIALISLGHRLAPRFNRWRWVHCLVSWVACHTRYGNRCVRELTTSDREVHGAFLLFTFMQLLLLGFVTISRIIIPPVAILMLIGWVTLLYFNFMWLRPVPRWGAVLLIVAVIVFGNSRPYKYTFPGFDTSNGQSAYAANQRIRLDAREEYLRPAGLIEPLQALKAWRAYAGQALQQEKPKLVVVSTEGGAYRAAFWTAVVLDELEIASQHDGPLHGFTSAIRLVTGASGGMVGAAYYVALRENAATAEPPSVVERLQQDILLSRRSGIHSTAFPISRDTLSPVVQQLVQRDIFSTLWPAPVAMERGRVLESHWRTLDVSFTELAEGERAGWRPSLLLTPTLVETGQQLAITNMNLDRLESQYHGELEEFFALFGAWHETFRLATAVRMNASFPYVSPAVSLPSEPTRRVVDAGYFDNYGVYIATAWLGQKQVANWIRNNTSGVILVQIHALPASKFKDNWLGRAFQWATSPLEAAISARTSTNDLRNKEMVRRLKELIQDVPVDTVIFGNDAESATVGKSWFLTEEELTETRKQFDTYTNQEALAKLKALWSSNLRNTTDNVNKQQHTVEDVPQS